MDGYNDEYTPIPSARPPAPQSVLVLDVIRCGCKITCDTDQSCGHRHNMTSSDLYECSPEKRLNNDPKPGLSSEDEEEDYLTGG